MEDERVMALDGMVKRLRACRNCRTTSGSDRRWSGCSSPPAGAFRGRAEDPADAELATKDAMIENLRRQLQGERRRSRRLKKRMERMRTVAKIEISEDYTPLKVLDSLTREGVRSLQEEVGIVKGDVLYVQRTHGWGRGVVKDLAGTGVRALVVGGEPPDPLLVRVAREAGLPLLPADAVRPDIRGRTGAAKTDALEDAVLEWEEEQKEYRREKETERLEYLFKEYRSEREKEVRRGG